VPGSAKAPLTLSSIALLCSLPVEFGSKEEAFAGGMAESELQQQRQEGKQEFDDLPAERR
jgi:hypothetical protein